MNKLGGQDGEKSISKKYRRGKEERGDMKEGLKGNNGRSQEIQAEKE